MTEVHVVPDDRTATWRVHDHDAAAPVSEHTSATEAELAARAHAEVRDAERIVVHDRYHRTYDDAPAPAQLRARARQERASQLAAVRTMQTVVSTATRPPGRPRAS